MRIAVYETGDSGPYAREHYGSYPEIFRDLLKRDGDSWCFFDSQKMEFPKDLDEFDACIITGSPSTAHEPEPWILRLNQDIVAMHRQKIKIVGICFGHQAIANALGGRSCLNPTGWEIGIHDLRLTPALAEKHYAPAADVPDSLLIIQSHRDHVCALPPGAQLLAESDLTPIQMFGIDDHVFSLQGHPEFRLDMSRYLIEIRRDAGKLEPQLVEEGLGSLNGPPADNEIWLDMIRSFLYGFPEKR